MKFDVVLKRMIEMEVTAEDIVAASAIAHKLAAEIGNCTVHSVFVEGYVPPAEEPEGPTFSGPPRGKPPTGPTPGTPDARLPDPLVDQIAKAA